MNLQNARQRAELETSSICSTLDYDFDVEKRTTLTSQNIIAGNGKVIELEERIATAIMHTDLEDSLNATTELQEYITKFVCDYLDDLGKIRNTTSFKDYEIISALKNNEINRNDIYEVCELNSQILVEFENGDVAKLSKQLDLIEMCE